MMSSSTRQSVVEVPPAPEKKLGGASSSSSTEEQARAIIRTAKRALEDVDNSVARSLERFLANRRTKAPAAAASSSR
ncbi:hypothetical protein BRADI_1g32515v3 [Brachypodium distachyon]|uniref:Uncharacterized protein n=1 Tax=Brachypodium distachyon TaxID=15368 RepID=A0A2K2DMC8_BRADI|nr:hypothetical protein BRADI_1g32515v3 [Brachypodium distachyon]